MDISGARLPGARFENTEWKDVKLERGALTNVTVIRSKLQGVSFRQSVLTDVTFEDTELRSTSFYKATLKRVRFVRCKLNGVTLDKMVDSTIEITDSKLLSTSLSDGQLQAIISKSILKDVELTDLTPPSSLIFEKSELNDLDFSRSVLTTFRLSESKIDDAAFTGTIADSVELVNSELFFSMSDSKVQNLLLSGSHVRAMVLNSAILPKVTIRLVGGICG